MSGRLAAICGAWVAAVLILLAIHILVPQRSGVLALTQVMEPFIVLTGLVAGAFALRGRAPWRMAVVAALVLVTVVHYGPIVLSFSGSSEGSRLDVVTWNALAGQADEVRVRAGLASIDADLVGLQELQPEAADMLAGDPELSARYPFRAMAPDYSVHGIGLLSQHPIVDFESSSDPPYIVAHVAPAGRDPISVFVAHPLPARIRAPAGIPVSLDATKRDSDIALIRSLIDREIALGRQVVVMGDFNVTEREPAYNDVSTGLRDAHLDAGIGFGLTWRPGALRSLPMGLL
ncbi:MAG TPA: endonuclease/exonuclease/phosphatase family protein, partial [Candidatus Limnocylindrales bacterium]|nr:endonuclease/exonuclease/phosphatase family protein [Candidatus Limnocylindrales bacterium]